MIQTYWWYCGKKLSHKDNAVQVFLLYSTKLHLSTKNSNHTHEPALASAAALRWFLQLNVSQNRWKSTYNHSVVSAAKQKQHELSWATITTSLIQSRNSCHQNAYKQFAEGFWKGFASMSQKQSKMERDGRVCFCKASRNQPSSSAARGGGSISVILMVLSKTSWFLPPMGCWLGDGSLHGAALLAFGRWHFSLLPRWTLPAPLQEQCVSFKGSASGRSSCKETRNWAQKYIPCQRGGVFIAPNCKRLFSDLCCPRSMLDKYSTAQPLLKANDNYLSTTVETVSCMSRAIYLNFHAFNVHTLDWAGGGAGRALILPELMKPFGPCLRFPMLILALPAALEK